MTSISTKSETNDDSSGGSDAETLVATLYLRSAPTGPAVRRQRTIRERFDSLDGDDGGPDRRTERWPRTVTTPVDEGEAAVGAALARYERLAAAVDAAGGRLQPFFQRRARSSGLLVGGQDEQVITFPVCCLVLERGEAVTGLYPCWLDGVHHSVEDGLDALAAGDAENLC